MSEIESEVEFDPIQAEERHPSLPGDLAALTPDDFQRIGLQPKETRLSVIRRAAIRTSQSLATLQLNSPSDITEQQLYRVALSTYRVLDPRQRPTARQRAHVGRIRPGALLYAGRTAFADGRSLDSSGGVLIPREIEELLRVDTLESAPFSDSTTLRLGKTQRLSNTRPLSGLRRILQHPVMILLMIVTLLAAAVAVWLWGQGQHNALEKWTSSAISISE